MSRVPLPISTMYICEAIGEETFVKNFRTKENAQKEMRRLIRRFRRDYASGLECADIDEERPSEFVFGASELFQCFFVYEKPKTLKEKMLLEIERASYGLTQYTYELMDSNTCGAHLDNLRRLVQEGMK